MVRRRRRRARQETTTRKLHGNKTASEEQLCVSFLLAESSRGISSTKSLSLAMSSASRAKKREHKLKPTRKKGCHVVITQPVLLLPTQPGKEFTVKMTTYPSPVRKDLSSPAPPGLS